MSRMRLLPVLLLILTLSLPLPRILFSYGFKIQGALLILLFFISTTFALFKGNIKRLNSTLIAIFLMLPLIYTAYGLFCGNDTYFSLKEFLFFSTPLWAFFIVVNSSREDDVPKLCNFIINLGVVMSIVLLVYELHGLMDFQGRYIYRWENMLLCVKFINVAYILYLAVSNTRRALFSPKYILLTSSLVLTMGRTELILVVFFLVFFLISGNFRSPKTCYLFFIICVISPLIYLIFLPDIEQMTPERSATWRLEEWSAYVRGLKEGVINPVFGNGFGFLLTPLHPLQLFSGEVLDKIERFHSLPLYLLVKTGIAGLGAFLIGIGSFLGAALKTKGLSREAKKMAATITLYLAFDIFLAGSVTGSFTSSITSGIALGLLLGILYTVKRSDAQKGLFDHKGLTP